MLSKNRSITPGTTEYGIKHEPNHQINHILWKFYYTDNLLHIHIPKCGGTWLKQIVYNTITGSHRFNFGHLPVTIVKNILDKQGYNWDDFSPFTIVRNPWDRLWSAYKYTRWGGSEVSLKQVEDPYGKYKADKKATQANTVWLPIPEDKIPIYDHNLSSLESLHEQSRDKVDKGWINNNMLAEKNFKEYITNLYNLKKPTKYKSDGENLWHKKIKHNIYLSPQIDYITNEEGEVIVPNIFKSTEMGKFLDWAERNSKDKEIKKRSIDRVSWNKSINQIHYKNIYDDDMINMVGELYQNDIKSFNFDYNN